MGTVFKPKNYKVSNVFLVLMGKGHEGSCDCNFICGSCCSVSQMDLVCAVWSNWHYDVSYHVGEIVGWCVCQINWTL